VDIVFIVEHDLLSEFSRLLVIHATKSGLATDFVE
jgi:hypothetical protein